MQDIRTQVGERIRALREERGISQEALADICKLHRTYVGLIERGKRNISLTTLEGIAAGLGVAVGELFVGVETASLAAKRPQKPPAGPDVVSQIAAIRQILISAGITDAQSYAAAVAKAKQEGKSPLK